MVNPSQIAAFAGYIQPHLADVLSMARLKDFCHPLSRYSLRLSRDEPAGELANPDKAKHQAGQRQNLADQGRDAEGHEGETGQR